MAMVLHRALTTREAMSILCSGSLIVLTASLPVTLILCQSNFFPKCAAITIGFLAVPVLRMAAFLQCQQKDLGF